MYDICIIGGGIIGCSIARELSKYNLKICLLEKNEDISDETTKANSGIVHGGYAEKYGSIKSQFCYPGNRLYQQLDNELHFGYAEVGSFVIGFDDGDAAKIRELYDNGRKNGVTSLQVVDGDFVLKKEPHLNRDIKVALYCPTAGITSPYEFAIALAENAIENGVTLKLNSAAIEINCNKNHFTVITAQQETLSAKVIINAAGLYADEVARMVGCDGFTITPRQGQYLLFDKEQGRLLHSVVFQTPTAISKGILATKTFHGNLLIGPDAETAPNKEYLDTHNKNISEIITTAKKSLPNFDMRKVITTFAGNRAVPSTGDFIIEESPTVKGFINVAGIESPGLTAAPAIALRVVEIVGATNKVQLTPKLNFNPNRRPYNAVTQMNDVELNALIKKEPCYGCIVCRCETVSEGEIRDALRRPIPINSMDAIKRRSRAGMGRCQSGFCTPKIMEIIEDELHLPKTKITKKGAKSLLVFGRTKRALE
jgi:glycerol-3-phosphate dehydrogenase